MGRFTYQERINHKWFLLNGLLFLISLMCFELGAIEGWIMPFFIGLIGLIVSFFNAFYNGYSHGWELKRISLDK